MNKINTCEEDIRRLLELMTWNSGSVKLGNGDYFKLCVYEYDGDEDHVNKNYQFIKAIMEKYMGESLGE